MATYCPCGCGKKLSLIERGGAKQVRKLAERVEFLETYALPLQRRADSGVEKFEEFIGDGRGFHDDMLAVIHGDLDSRSVDRKEMNAWSVAAAGIERQTKVTLYQLHKDR